ncbi:MAG: hypothetical protein HFE77_04495 [Clostridiales bacterium]|nr:hypothetical protein [Clostridiales bacterium]
MLIKIIMIIGWIMLMRVVSLSAHQTNQKIDDFLKIIAAIRFGVCERHMGLNDIYAADHEDLFDEIKHSSLFHYANQKKEALGLSEMIIQKLHFFEKQTAVASFAECESQVFELSALVSKELEERKIQLKRQLTGTYTIVTAVFLIIMILLI